MYIVFLQTSISDMSATMKQVRSSMEQDEQLKVLMAGFRGSNLDESDFASANVRMRLVTDLQDDGLDAALPLSYDPDAINRWAGNCKQVGGGATLGRQDAVAASIPTVGSSCRCCPSRPAPGK